MEYEDVLIAVDKLHEVARFVEENYEDSGLHVLLRYCADELSDLRKIKKTSEFATVELINKIKTLSKN